MESILWEDCWDQSLFGQNEKIYRPRMCPKIKYCFNESYTRLNPKEINTITIEEAGQPEDSVKFDLKSPEAPEILTSSIKMIKRLPTTWKETYLVHLDSEFDYSPCDSIGIYAPNPDELVGKIFELCGFRDRGIRVERTGQSPFFFEGKLSYFIKHRLDITTLPKKSFLMNLSRTAKKHQQLEYLCSREGVLDYLSLGANWNTLVDILEEFGPEPSLEDLLMNCELIKPRYYSLLNRKAEILVGVISKTVDSQTLFGHVSRFVRDLYFSSAVEAPVEICFRKNKLFDSIPTNNLVCFCTGTGIAPYIAFYRSLVQPQKLDGHKEIRLVYGFRNDEDNILDYFDIDCQIAKVKSSENNYIQDNIDIIGRCGDDCSVFICGNIRVQKAVFMKIKEAYPKLVEDKKIFFDNWQ